MKKKASSPLGLLLALSALLVLAYAGLAVALGTTHLLATVTSDSMRPALERGDWVLLERQPEYAVGDVVVFSMGAGNVYVHRVAAVVGDAYGGGYRTKGDANPYPDGWTVPPSAVLGRVVLRIPRLGYLSLWLGGR